MFSKEKGEGLEGGRNLKEEKGEKRFEEILAGCFGS